MSRRTSGWTIVKRVAREIDRANRQSQREAIARQKEAIRQQERLLREQKKIIDHVAREGGRSQERFNKALSMAATTMTLSTKEEKLAEAKQHLNHLKNLQQQHDFFQLSNLSGVEKNIVEVEKEIELLKAEEKEKKSLEKSTVLNTYEAQEIRTGIENVLLHTLDINDALDWKVLKDHQPFLIPIPNKPPRPMLPSQPTLIEVAAEPSRDADVYKPRIPLYLYLFKDKVKSILAEATQAYEEDLQEWRSKSDLINSENEESFKNWEKDKAAILTEWEYSYKTSCDEWRRRKEEHETNQSQYNGGIDKLKSEYERKEKAAVEEYCRLVLAKSEYPFSFQKDYKIEFFSDEKLLALDYQLPTMDVVPRLKEEKYIKARGEIKQSFITDKQQKDIYENLLYKMVIRTIHEIFEADVINAISAVAVNGWVTILNKATGHDETRCIITINVNKEPFLKINLANVDAKECFKNLKGIGGAKLSELVPVAPIITLNKDDSRFVDSYDVLKDVAQGDNLALMNWEDFEHLIRELFEKEFCSNGSEVRVTQASRDGGVDAIIYDPDPIRGGKIIIQAKRYTNTVGVSAVRDLYGTVQHEGAMKGILITTSNYGRDAYEFAKGKPLTLMNGGNLIFLLERHGRKARIDLLEAKKILEH